MDTNNLISPDSSIGIDALSIAAFLRDGGHVAVLTGPARPGLTAVLDRALSELQGQVVRIGNALASPLTLDRILFQLGAVSDGEADPVAYIRAALADEAGADPALLVIEDAQTLDPNALATLASLPRAAEGGRPGLAIVLAGRPELLRMLSAPDLTSLWAPLTRMTLREVGAPDIEPMSVPAEEAFDDPPSRPPLDPRPVAPRLVAPPPPPARRRSPAKLLAAAAVAGLAVTLAMLAVSRDRSAPDQPPAAITPAPDPQSAKPAVAAPAPPATPAAPDPATEPASAPTPEQLRRDFDAFLNRAGQDTASLTPARRATLFQEYLNWRARTMGERDAPPSPPAVPAARTP